MMLRPRYAVWIHEVKIDLINDNVKPVHYCYKKAFLFKRRAAKYYDKVSKDITMNGYNGHFLNKELAYDEKYVKTNSNSDHRVFFTNNHCIDTFVQYGKIERFN